MNCKACGNPLTVEDKFCKKCGTPVASSVVNAQNTVAQPVPPTQPVVQPVVQPAPQVGSMPQQTQVPVQQMMGPAPMPGMYPPPPKKGISPILTIIFVIIALVGGYFGFKLLSGSKIVASETTKINVAGYEFEVPVDMQVKYNSTTADLSNENINITIGVLAGDYNRLNTNSVLSSVKGSTYDGEKTYKGKNYHLFNVTDGVYYAKFLYFPITSDRTGLIAVSVGDEKSNPSSKELDVALKIALSAKASTAHSAKIGGIDDETKDNMLNVFLEQPKEETVTGDILEDIYEDTYVNITLDEINE